MSSTQYSALTTQYPLAVLLLAYLIVGGLFAIFTPAWQSPDEPAHYNYAAQVAADGCCPVIEVGDWDAAYLDQLKAARFAPELLGKLEAVQYEDHQPPLYYLLGGIVLRLTNGSLIALRLLSVLIGAGVVWCAYMLARAMLPERPGVALGTAALVAFLPQHVHTLSSANNDGLAELFIGLTLLALVRSLKNANFRLFYRLTNWGVIVPALVVSAFYLSDNLTVLLAVLLMVIAVMGSALYARGAATWSLGTLVGLGLLTKVSTLFLLGLVPLAILFRWWFASGFKPAFSLRNLRPLFRALLLFAIPALLLAGFWWVRNLNLYGVPDVFGLRAHDRVVAGQLRTDDYIAALGLPAYLSTALQTTFNSFWGQFGWMALPLPAWAYLAILALILVSLGGLALDRQVLRRRSPPGSVSLGQQLSWLMLALTALLAALAYLYYNTEFVQFQGRYLYPGLIPFALGLTLGLDAWAQFLAGRVGENAVHRRGLAYAPALVFLLFIPLDLYLLWRVIVPGLQP